MSRNTGEWLLDYTEEARKILSEKGTLDFGLGRRAWNRHRSGISEDKELQRGKYIWSTKSSLIWLKWRLCKAKMWEGRRDQRGSEKETQIHKGFHTLYLGFGLHSASHDAEEMVQDWTSSGPTSRNQSNQANSPLIKIQGSRLRTKFLWISAKPAVPFITSIFCKKSKPEKELNTIPWHSEISAIPAPHNRWSVKDKSPCSVYRARFPYTH